MTTILPSIEKMNPTILCLIALLLVPLSGYGSPQAARTAAVRKLLVDPDATPETVALFYNLKQSAKHRILIGQQNPDETFLAAAGESDIRKVTGNDPAVWGSQIRESSVVRKDGKNLFHEDLQKNLRFAAAAYDKGMVNTFWWCLTEPYAEQKWLRDDLPREVLQKAFRSILPGGVNHDWYKGKLRKVAGILGSIKGRDGTLAPVIFRPFHEFDGSWFWWGKDYSTAAEFQSCWRFTVNYLRDECKAHNLLYAFSPDCTFTSENAYLERYPGDAYVDVVGFDDYADFEKNDVAAAAAKILIVSNYAKNHRKLAALTEVGYRKQPVPRDLYTARFGAALADPSLELAYLMFWRQGRSDKDGYFVPPPGADTVGDFLKFTRDSKLGFLPESRSLY